MKYYEKKFLVSEFAANLTMEKNTEGLLYVITGGVIHISEHHNQCSQVSGAKMAVTRHLITLILTITTLQ